jgi:hypothetical protein
MRRDIRLLYLPLAIAITVSFSASTAQGETGLNDGIGIPLEGITAADVGLPEEDFVTPELAKKAMIKDYCRNIPESANEGISVIVEPWIIESLDNHPQPLGFYSVTITAGPNRPREFEEMIGRSRELYEECGSVTVNDDGTFSVTKDKEVYRNYYSFFNPDETYRTRFIPVNKNYNQTNYPCIFSDTPSLFVFEYPYMEAVAKEVLHTGEVNCVGYFMFYDSRYMAAFRSAESGETVYINPGGRYRVDVSDFDEMVSGLRRLKGDVDVFSHEYGPNKIGYWDFLDQKISDVEAIPPDPGLLINEFADFHDEKTGKKKEDSKTDGILLSPAEFDLTDWVSAALTTEIPDGCYCVHASCTEIVDAWCAGGFDYINPENEKGIELNDNVVPGYEHPYRDGDFEDYDFKHDIAEAWMDYLEERGGSQNDTDDGVFPAFNLFIDEKVKDYHKYPHPITAWVPNLLTQKFMNGDDFPYFPETDEGNNYWNPTESINWDIIEGKVSDQFGSPSYMIVLGGSESYGDGNWIPPAHAFSVVGYTNDDELICGTHVNGYVDYPGDPVYITEWWEIDLTDPDSFVNPEGQEWLYSNLWTEFIFLNGEGSDEGGGGGGDYGPLITEAYFENDVEGLTFVWLCTNITSISGFRVVIKDNEGRSTYESEVIETKDFSDKYEFVLKGVELRDGEGVFLNVLFESGNNFLQPFQS